MPPLLQRLSPCSEFCRGSFSTSSVDGLRLNSSQQEANLTPTPAQVEKSVFQHGMQVVIKCCNCSFLFGAGAGRGVAGMCCLRGRRVMSGAAGWARGGVTLRGGGRGRARRRGGRGAVRAPEATGAVLSSRGAAARFPACPHALLAPHAPAQPFSFDVYLHRAACWNLRLNPRAAPHPSQRAHWRCLVGHADGVIVGAPAAALQLGGSGPPLGGRFRCAAGPCHPRNRWTGDSHHHIEPRSRARQHFNSTVRRSLPLVLELSHQDFKFLKCFPVKGEEPRRSYASNGLRQ